MCFGAFFKEKSSTFWLNLSACFLMKFSLISSRFALIAVFLLTTGATDVRFRAFLELDVAATEDRLLAANWLAITEEAMAKVRVLLLVYKMRLIEQMENDLKLD
jgi:hypothetical protein